MALTIKKLKMRFRLFLVSLVIFPILVASAGLHDYFVSVTVVEYSEKEKSLQIISQIFIDDLEELIRTRYDETVTLEGNDEPMMVDDYVQRYLSKKLIVNVNGNEKQFNYIGKEYIDDIAYCYLEIAGISDIKSLDITNKILFDVIPEQQNIVRFKLKGKNKSFILLPGKDNCVLNFD